MPGTAKAQDHVGIVTTLPQPPEVLDGELTVTVADQDAAPACGAYPGAQRGPVAAITIVPEEPHTWVGSAGSTDDNRCRVTTAVVDEVEFVVDAPAFEILYGPLNDHAYHIGLVEHRDHHAEFGCGFGWLRRCHPG
ncbi:MAG: hypothetical protein VB852_01795 [Deltaproteobacteria bacterium]